MNPTIIPSVEQPGLFNLSMVTGQGEGKLNSNQAIPARVPRYECDPMIPKLGYGINERN